MWNPIAWLASGTVKALTGQLLAAYEAKLAATNDHQKIEADKQIALTQARLQAQIANGGSLLFRLVQVGFALPFVIYNAKLVLWDKVLKLGATDGLSDNLTDVQGYVLAFFLLGMTADRLLRR